VQVPPPCSSSSSSSCPTHPGGNPAKVSPLSNTNCRGSGSLPPIPEPIMLLLLLFEEEEKKRLEVEMRYMGEVGKYWGGEGTPRE